MSTYALICSLAISDDRLLKKLIFRLNFTKKSPHKETLFIISDFRIFLEESVHEVAAVLDGFFHIAE